LRILIVDTCYPAFLKSHYRRSPGLEAQPYAIQWRALMDTFFGTADAYSHNLTTIGHDSHELVVNCAPLQAAWAREHDLAVPDDGAEEAILLAQAREFAPDVVYVQHVHYLSDATLAELKRLGRLLVGQIATEPPSLDRLRTFDLLVTCLPSFVTRFNAQGVRTELLRLAFDERVLEELSTELRPRSRAAVFVGSLGRTQHRRSNGMIARAARRVPIEFWGHGGRLWPPWSPVKRGYRGEAWGLDMFRILGEARVAVNRHGSIAGPYAVNMRLYEATGMGSLLVTDNGDQLGDVLRPEEEAVSYSTAHELVERLRYFLDHEDERAEIAAAGQARTLRDHTYRRRMRQLAAMLEDAAA
jgi:spore maturation protein CgeB